MSAFNCNRALSVRAALLEPLTMEDQKDDILDMTLRILDIERIESRSLLPFDLGGRLRKET